MFLQKLPHISVLKIQYLPRKGLKLIWNFNGFLNHQFSLKHLFIISGMSQNLANKFLSIYIQKIKGGDLYKVIWNEDCIKASMWRQKLFNTQFQCSRHQYQSSITSLISILKKICVKDKPYTHSIIVYLLIGKTNLIQNYIQKVQNCIKQLRTQNCLQFIVNILGPFKTNNISATDGINYFHLSNSSNISSLSESLKLYISQIAVSSLQVQLQCSNAQLIAQKNQNWDNKDFSIIRKVYFGLTSYQNSQLLVIKAQKRNIKNYRFNVKIFYTLFNQKCFTDSKIFELVASQIFNENSTYNYPQKLFSQAFGLILQRNPFQSITFAYLKQQGETKQ